MSHIVIAIGALTLGVLLALPLGMLVARRASQRYRHERAELQERLRAERAELLEQVQQTAAVAERQLKQLEQYEQDVREERARADRYFLAIDTVVRERDRWSAAYRDAAGGHQKAQEMMMAEIKRLSWRLDRAKALLDRHMTVEDPEGAREKLRELLTPKFNEGVAAVVREFYAEHGAPMARAPGAIEGAEETIARQDTDLARQKGWVTSDPGASEQEGVSDDPRT